ncbi:MAG: hypothetical protein VX346_13920 [Planctomycetota bacterium]|nr:hypothetical protein [Planctomycetota bacterium]
MAKILALESDAQEFRLLIGTPRGRDVVIEEALSIAISEDSGANAAALASALESRKIDKADVFVAIGRSQVELRLLSLPLSPPEELPEMVRFQAMRQFANIGETWPLDFVTLSDTSDDSQMNVLAAAISPEQVDQICTGCSVAQLSPQRMVLRPFASASLLRHQGKANQGDCQLLISMTSSEAELTVLSDGQAAFLRAVRLPLDDAGNLVPKALVGEVRRTIGAAQNQLNGRTVDKICLCQGAAEASALLDSLTSELSLEIDRLDPFDGMRLSKKLESDPPTYPGRFAGLLGVLADEAKETHTGIDFLHPRQKPPPPSKLRRNLWIGTGGGAIAAAVLLYVTVTIWMKSTEIADLKATIAANQKNLEVAQQDIENEAAISVFLQGDITWLDELLWLSQTFPDAEDALIKTLSLNANSKQGGRIDLDAFARTGETIGRAEAVLRDDRHEVQPDGSQEDSSKKGYYHSFRERILVQKDQSLPSRLVQGEDTGQQEDDTEGNAVDPSDESDPPRTDPAESTPNNEPSERASTDATTRAVSAREDLEGEVNSK